MVDKNIWKGKRVFITGHTGFKGSWLCLWLNQLGAKVTGYALTPPTKPSLFEICRVNKLVDSVVADIRDLGRLKKVLRDARPEIVFHLAAQPIVRDSYKVPVDTFSTNVIGTVNILEAARSGKELKAVVNVTTDKCYENKEKKSGYKETDPLGGYDPYSSSKACSELVAAAYRRSFGMPIATARAGNVIGGGDWATDRLVPDFVRSIMKGGSVRIRNPYAVRPWQHVLEPLSGYLMLAEKIYLGGDKYCEAWNFGPLASDAKPVEWLVSKLCRKWGGKSSYNVVKGPHPHETGYLKLDWSKANARLGWQPRWRLEKALDKVVEWTKAYQNGEEMRRICLEQIEEYCER